MIPGIWLFFFDFYIFKTILYWKVIDFYLAIFTYNSLYIYSDDGATYSKLSKMESDCSSYEVFKCVYLIAS